jgi:Fibronectin type III domain.
MCFILIAALWAGPEHFARAGESITLGWIPSLSPQAAGYAVYYGTHSGSYRSRIDVGTNISLTVTNLSSWPTYYFAVATYDTNEFESILSEEVSYSAASAPPVFGAITVSDGQVKITWRANLRHAYQVQVTTNLQQMDWQSLGEVIIPTGSSASFSEPLQEDAQRFYRLMMVPAAQPPDPQDSYEPLEASAQ